MDWMKYGNITAFDQREFFNGTDEQFNVTGLDDTGYYFKPNSCGSERPCKLHVAIHGCD